jgi:hypothetical protein
VSAYGKKMAARAIIGARAAKIREDAEARIDAEKPADAIPRWKNGDPRKLDGTQWRTWWAQYVRENFDLERLNSGSELSYIDDVIAKLGGGEVGKRRLQEYVSEEHERESAERTAAMTHRMGDPADEAKLVASIKDADRARLDAEIERLAAQRTALDAPPAAE